MIDFCSIYYSFWVIIPPLPVGPKTLPTIWGTYMKLVTKYQISAINSCWEKCAYMFNVYKDQLSWQTGSRNLTGPKTLPTIWYTYMNIYAHFSSHFSTQLLMAEKSDIWSQASYRYPISWESFFDLSDSYFLFAKERGYHRWALALITELSPLHWKPCNQNNPLVIMIGTVQLKDGNCWELTIELRYLLTKNIPLGW
jgi:hypothetical protein